MNNATWPGSWPPQPPQPPRQQGLGRDERLAKVEVAVLGVLLVLTVLGNAVVLLALYARRRCGGRRKLSRMFFFILHLSVADMVTAFFSVLPQLVWKVTFRFQGGNVLCKVVKFGQPLGVYLSSYVLTATALDRYRAICHPLTYCSWTSSRAKMMVYAAWAVAVCFSAPQAFIFSLRELGPDESDCWADFHPDWGVRSYVTWYACSVFVVPLLVLSFTYSRITCEIWRCASSRTAVPAAAARTPPTHGQHGQHGQHGKADTACQQAHAYAYRFTTPRQGGGGGARTAAGSFVAVRVRSATTRTNPLISRAKINTVKQSVLVIMLYIVCSGPFICAQLWSAWTSPAEDDYLSESSTLYTILTLLFSLNSCVNPWIYLAFNKDLTSTLSMLVSCKGPMPASSMQSSCSSPPNGAVQQLGRPVDAELQEPCPPPYRRGRGRGHGLGRVRVRSDIMIVLGPRNKDLHWVKGRASSQPEEPCSPSASDIKAHSVGAVAEMS